MKERKREGREGKEKRESKSVKGKTRGLKDCFLLLLFDRIFSAREVLF